MGMMLGVYIVLAKYGLNITTLTTWQNGIAVVSHYAAGYVDSSL